MNAAAMSTYRMLSDLGSVVGPIALGIATTSTRGLDSGGHRRALVLVALAFMRLAPESFRSGRFWVSHPAVVAAAIAPASQEE